MNKTIKYILVGIGSFIGCLLIIVVIRALIKGIPYADVIRNWNTWLFAAFGGVGSAYSVWKKDLEKK